MPAGMGCGADTPHWCLVHSPQGEFCMSISLWDKENISSGKSESNCALADKVDSPLLAAVFLCPPCARWESSAGRDGEQVPSATRV